MRSSTEVPCPTSSASRSKAPGGGSARGGHSSGTSNGSASARTRHGNGHQQHRAEQPGELRPGRRHGHQPDRDGPGRERAQHRVEQLHDPGTDAPQRQQHDTEQRQWRNHQRDQGNGDQVGREADHRDLLEEHQRQRGQTDGRDYLGA